MSEHRLVFASSQYRSFLTICSAEWCWAVSRSASDGFPDPIQRDHLSTNYMFSRVCAATQSSVVKVPT